MYANAVYLAPNKEDLAVVCGNIILIVVCVGILSAPIHVCFGSVCMRHVCMWYGVYVVWCVCVVCVEIVVLLWVLLSMCVLLCAEYE